MIILLHGFLEFPRLRSRLRRHVWGWRGGLSRLGPCLRVLLQGRRIKILAAIHVELRLRLAVRSHCAHIAGRGHGGKLAATRRRQQELEVETRHVTQPN